MNEEQMTNGGSGQQYGDSTAPAGGQYGGNQYQTGGQYGGNPYQTSGQYGSDPYQTNQQYSGNQYQADGQYGGVPYQTGDQYGYNAAPGNQAQYGGGLDPQSFGAAAYSNPGYGYSSAAVSTPEKVSSNVIPGIVGAFLGSLVGVAMWIVVYNLGYIAGLSGAVMVICSMMAYKKFGKCLDLKGIIICVVLCIGMIYISQRLSLSIELYKEFNDYGYDVSFFDCYKNMFDVLDAADNKSAFWGDLGMGYALFALASTSYIVSTIRNRSK